MFSNHPSPRLRAAGVCLLVLLIGGVVWRFREQPRPRAAAQLLAREEARPPARVLEPGPAKATLAPDVAPRTQPAAQPASLEPVAEAIREVFPGIVHAVPDWRAFRPETLTVAPYPDLPMTFTRTAVKDEGYYVTWIGRIPNLPGASLVGVATPGGYDAIVVVPGANQFSIHVRGGTVVTTEAAPGEETCGNLPVLKKSEPVNSSASYVVGVSYAPGYTPVPDSAVEAPLKVDVLVAYDADTLKAATASSNDPVGYIDGQCKAQLETGNLVLAQSGVTAFSWRYLGAVAAPAYPRTGKSVDDVQALAPGGALADWAKTTRYQHGADQLVLLIGGDMDFSGRAYSGKQVAAVPDFACAVAKWGNSYKTIVHELAHNFGCLHDRAHTNVISPGEYGDATPDNDGYYCYGQLWDNPPLPPGYTGGRGTTGTIMSYGDWIIPYYSNPNISVHVTGALIGWTLDLEQGVQQTGRAETDAKAAYNARVLNDQALAMSRLQDEITTPAITDQPRNASAIRGNSLSVSVGATGGGLSYQWLKNGVALAGATASLYSKTADDADAGTYTVTVSNLKGSVTSNGASVSVSAPPPPTPPPSSGGGGGGGGAPSVWFLGLVGACALLRWFPGRRN